MKLEGRIVTAGGLVSGSLEIDGDRIVSTREEAAPNRTLLLPGFVDLHVHGGGGADVMDGPEGVAAVAAFHLRYGTTSLCPTTVTLPLAELTAAVKSVSAMPDDSSRARSLGVHLEGPFLASSKLGAQPPHELAPDLAALEGLLDTGAVAIVTLAPELPGALDLVRALAARGVRVSLGHSACDYATARAAFDAGATGVTHLFNAMSGLHHRAPGLAAAALDDERPTLELILDGHHVHLALFRLAWRLAPERLLLVSDAIRAAGLPDGESELGGQTVRVASGRVSLPDGTLAGSVLTLDRALAHAIDAGLEPWQASALLSRQPAAALGRKDIGHLEPGAFADVLEVDADDLSLRRVFRSGAEVPR